jgi:hypothetical protein
MAPTTHVRMLLPRYLRIAKLSAAASEGLELGRERDDSAHHESTWSSVSENAVPEAW